MIPPAVPKIVLVSQPHRKWTIPKRLSPQDPARRRYQIDDEQITSKRHEVRKAHLYLQKECNPELLHVGDIPSSWESENGDGKNMHHNQRDSQHSPDLEPQDLCPSSIIFDDDSERSRRAYKSDSLALSLLDRQQSDAMSMSISESLLAPLRAGIRRKIIAKSSMKQIEGRKSERVFALAWQRFAQRRRVAIMLGWMFHWYQLDTTMLRRKWNYSETGGLDHQFTIPVKFDG